MEQYNNDITNNIKITIKKTSNVNSVCQKPEVKINVNLKNIIQCGSSTEFVVSEGLRLPISHTILFRRQPFEKKIPKENLWKIS